MAVAGCLSVLGVLLGVWLLSLMSGLMGAWFRIRSLVIHRQDRVFFIHHPGQLWADRRWDHLDDDIGGDGANRSCRGYCSVPGPLQAAYSIHLGADNLSVVRHGRAR